MDKQPWFSREGHTALILKAEWPILFKRPSGLLQYIGSDGLNGHGSGLTATLVDNRAKGPYFVINFILIVINKF